MRPFSFLCSTHRLGGLPAVLLSVLAVPSAQATVTVLPAISAIYQRQVSLRIGSGASIPAGTSAPATGMRNTVTFDVSNAPGTQGQAVAGVSDETGASPGVSIEVEVLNRNGIWPGIVSTSLRLTADSSVALTCQTSSSCGATTIPFSKISWQSNNRQATGAYVGYDLPNGAFNGSATQDLLPGYAPSSSGWAFSVYNISSNPEGNGIRISNTLVFRYANDVIYPAGTYKGTVTYTAATF